MLLSGLGRCMYARPIIHGTGLLLLLESAGGILQHVVAVLRARRAGMSKQLAHRGLCAVWSFRAHCFKKKGPLLCVLMCARRESCERRIGIPVGVHTCGLRRVPGVARKPRMQGTGLLLLLESAGGVLQHVLAVVRARRA